MNYRALCEVAMLMSQEAHEGQKYGTEDYWDYHIHGVVCRVQDYAITNKITDDTALKLSIVAQLHDAIEDSDLTLDDLRKAGFPDDVVEAIDLVTKPEGFNKKEDLWPYLEAIRENELARPVKMCDNIFNMTNSLFEGNLGRAQYYFKQAKFLADK